MATAQVYIPAGLKTGLQWLIYYNVTETATFTVTVNGDAGPLHSSAGPGNFTDTVTASKPNLTLINEFGGMFMTLDIEVTGLANPADWSLDSISIASITDQTPDFAKAWGCAAKRGSIVFGYVGSDAPLYVASHASLAAVLGSHTAGWSTPVSLASYAEDVAIGMWPNGATYLTYTKCDQYDGSRGAYYRYATFQGPRTAPQWGAETPVTGYWLLSFSGSSGSFTLTWGGDTTPGIAYSSGLTAATIQTALASIGAGYAMVSGPNGGPFTILILQTPVGTLICTPTTVTDTCDFYPAPYVGTAQTNGPPMMFVNSPSRGGGFDYFRRGGNLLHSISSSCDLLFNERRGVRRGNAIVSVKPDGTGWSLYTDDATPDFISVYESSNAGIQDATFDGYKGFYLYGVDQVGFNGLNLNNLFSTVFPNMMSEPVRLGDGTLCLLVFSYGWTRVRPANPSSWVWANGGEQPPVGGQGIVSNPADFEITSATTVLTFDLSAFSGITGATITRVGNVEGFYGSGFAYNEQVQVGGTYTDMPPPISHLGTVNGSIVASGALLAAIQAAAGGTLTMYVKIHVPTAAGGIDHITGGFTLLLTTSSGGGGMTVEVKGTAPTTSDELASYSLVAQYTETPIPAIEGAFTAGPGMPDEVTFAIPDLRYQGIAGETMEDLYPYSGVIFNDIVYSKANQGQVVVGTDDTSGYNPASPTIYNGSSALNNGALANGGGRVDTRTFDCRYAIHLEQPPTLLNNTDQGTIFAAAADGGGAGGPATLPVQYVGAFGTVTINSIQLQLKAFYDTIGYGFGEGDTTITGYVHNTSTVIAAASGNSIYYAGGSVYKPGILYQFTDSPTSGATIDCDLTLATTLVPPQGSAASPYTAPIYQVNVYNAKFLFSYEDTGGTVGHFFLLRSRDNGVTWEYAGDAGQISALANLATWNNLGILPLIPCLVADQQILSILWVEGGSISAISSLDQGETWN
jgi:hypothetical protein